ncbi:MAG: response regulator [Pirellulaceae bacterium]|nr:response regulator [Planctomycetales bacterium]
MLASSDALLEPEMAEVPSLVPHVVLIVDDEPHQTEVLSERLSRQGFKTVTAANGAEAEQMLQQYRPHLIVLDIHLPDVSGLDLCQRWSDAPETCEIPIVIVSGSDAPDTIRRCRSAGCRYFVRKPYDPNALLTLMRSCLSDHSW